MAGFKTHISVSTTLGIAYAGAGWYYGLPPADAILAGTLCSLGGMLPDLDSKSGVPVRETFAFLSAIVPMLVIERLRASGISPHSQVLVGIATYIVMRFGVSNLFKRYTVHRGMWHSIPAAASAGLLVYLLSYADGTLLALYNAGAVVLGFLSHLVLDELWSLQVRRGRLRIKKSFGTALKLWSSRSLWANVSTYGKLLILAVLAVKQPDWLAGVHYHQTSDAPPVHRIADDGRALPSPTLGKSGHRGDESNAVRR